MSAFAAAFRGLSNGKSLSASMHAPGNRQASTNNAIQESPTPQPKSQPAKKRGRDWKGVRKQPHGVQAVASPPVSSFSDASSSVVSSPVASSPVVSSPSIMPTPVRSETTSSSYVTTNPDAQRLKAEEMGRAYAREQHEQALAAEAIAQTFLSLSNEKPLSASIHAPGNPSKVSSAFSTSPVAGPSKEPSASSASTIDPQTMRAMEMGCLRAQEERQKALEAEMIAEAIRGLGNGKNLTTTTVPVVDSSEAHPPAAAPVDARILRAIEMGRLRAQEEHEKALEAEAIAKVIRGMGSGKKVADSMNAPANRKPAVSSSTPVATAGAPANLTSGLSPTMPATADDAQALRAKEMGRLRVKENYEKALRADAIAEAIRRLGNGKKLADSMRAPANRKSRR
ncbi:hypothetical protein QBC35DRAFT_457456 [Podospora australis]|uniref:Uncharacterized protein n=1 Tax=Podospora australis TaxID=1536484 RepID=A0AAN6WJ99_9PEZI|nr:hypothetical protein QBC35DRAFT_457456 [Podospora australis]